MAKIILSEGASWVVERLPDSVYDRVKEEIEYFLELKMFQVGYDQGIRMSFNEEKPARLERKP